MDAEKVTQVEMKELTLAEVQDDKDAEKCKMEGIRGKKKTKIVCIDSILLSINDHLITEK